MVGTVFAALFFLLAVYRIFLSLEGRRAKDIAVYILLALNFLLLKFENVEIFYYLTFFLLFNLLNTTHGSKKAFIFGAMILAFLPLNLNLLITAQSAFLALLPTAEGSSKIKENKKVELNRDLVHLGIGVSLISLLYLVENEAEAYSIILALITLGFLLSNYAVLYRKSRISKFLYSLERDYAKFGIGAVWLALGTLFSLGFIFNKWILLAIMACFLIGDPLATLFGLRYGKHKLLYNKRKSIEGSLVYFISSSLVGFIFIGFYSFIIGILGALIESVDIKIDDNLLVPFLLGALLYVYYLI